MRIAVWLRVEVLMKSFKAVYRKVKSQSVGRGPVATKYAVVADRIVTIRIW